MTSETGLRWAFVATVLLVALAATPAAASPVLIEATSLSMADDASPPIDARKRRLSFRATTSRAAQQNRITPPVRGGGDDPTVVGATLIVANAAHSGEIVRVALPAAGWLAQGSDQHPHGFVYRDRAQNAPVDQVSISADHLTVRASGPGWTYTLDEPQQSRVALRLDLGGSAWCAEAPARTRGNPPSSAPYDAPGKFIGQAKAPPPAVCALNLLTVGNGYGSGIYPSGSTVHVFAAVQPQNQLVTSWTGDAGLLDDPLEWHSTLVMPAADASVTATIVARPVSLAVSTYTGTTARPKTVRSLIPAGARGLVLFLHGTSGDDTFITKEESFYVALRALESGYGVLGTEAEEAVAGDLNGDGKLRWDASLASSNVDLGNLDSLIASLRASGAIGPTTPLLVLGMSNGGSMAVSLGAVGAAPSAATFPNLRFAAAISFCAEARSTAVALTTTPTAWLLCANDDNDEVDNATAAANSAALAARGVPTMLGLHPASPLYDQRFVRVPGVTLATSLALAADARAAGFVGADGFFVTPTDDLIAAVTANPSLMPSLVGLPGGVQLDVIDQVRAMQAEHQMYSDWAYRAVAFFDAHAP